MNDGSFDPLRFVRSAAPWLAAPELGTCLVGSQALAVALQGAGEPGPTAADLDLSWTLDHDAGTELLQRHGVHLPTTAGNQQRGTLAMKLAGRRVEITTFRNSEPDAPVAERIAADLSARDMTIGALAVELANGRVHDPHGGARHFRERRIVPVGDVAQRVVEHPIRWLRYYRKAFEFDFALDRAVRALDLEPSILRTVPAEAVALELRAVLGRCASPGRCLLELHEARVLATLSPEIARQFDGRPAGPQRHHPEVSQALHLILALEWAAANTHHLDERDRLTALFCTLCHDLGKGDTGEADLPRHIGHERAGVQHVDALAKRWPGLADQRAVALARKVAELHVTVRNFAELRPSTLAKLYDRHFRAGDFPVELFALAVGADSAGRLGRADTGAAVRDHVMRDLQWLREVGASVDAAALRQRFGDDVAGFREALHEARTRAFAARRRAQD